MQSEPRRADDAPLDRRTVLAIAVAALGYFVDLFDLVLFSILRIPSLKAMGVTDPDELTRIGKNLLDIQLIGMLLGGIAFGMLGDRFGRLKTLFGSILLYSVANILNAFVTDVWQYEVLRFVAGFGLAGELGAGITLVAELLPTRKRGIGTTVVAVVGLSGAVAAGLRSWRCAWACRRAVSSSRPAPRTRSSVAIRCNCSGRRGGSLGLRSSCSAPCPSGSWAA